MIRVHQCESAAKRLFARGGLPLYHQAVREQVLHYIRERNLLHAGDRVAVAVSGGADSVALLRVLLELRPDLGIVLAVAHFNHRLRGSDSDADEKFVADLAQCHDLASFAGRSDIREHAAINRLSIEHAARDLRYAWLMKLAQEQQFEAIATAHTFDDQAETVLMKFLRGAGTKGLAGIHPVIRRDGVRIIRPLLETPRSDIEQYLSLLAQTWREDETNRDLCFARNRIRHELLPLLERDYNPNLRELLNDAAEVALAEEDYWQQVAQSFLDQWCKSSGPLQLRDNFSPSVGFLSQPLATQRRILKCFLELRDLPTDFHHVEALRRCALGQASQVDLPGGWIAQLNGDWLELDPPPTRLVHPVTSYERLVPIPGMCAIPEARLTVKVTLVPSDLAAGDPPGSLLCLAKISTKLLIRNWQPGDRFRPAHSGSEEKLKRLFAEKHISAGQRPLWPVVLAGSQIVWVRGFPVARDYAWVPGSGDAARIDVLPDE